MALQIASFLCYLIYTAGCIQITAADYTSTSMNARSKNSTQRATDAGDKHLNVHIYLVYTTYTT